MRKRTPKGEANKYIVRSHLMSELGNGKYQIGSRLPTEMELAKQFNISRAQVHWAVRQLELDGLVTRNKRGGTTVAAIPYFRQVERIRNHSSRRIYILASPFSQWIVQWNVETVQSLTETFQTAGYQCTVYDLPKTREKLEDIFTEICATGCYAVVLLPEHQELAVVMNNQDIVQRYHGNVYFYNCGELNSDQLFYHEIVPNHYEAGFLAGSHIGQLNCAGYILLRYQSGELWLHRFCNGVRTGLRVHFPEPPAEFITPNAASHAEILDEICRQLLAARPRRLGVITATDGLAAELLQYASDRYHLNAPADFLLIGQSNYVNLRQYNITTVATTSNIAFIIARMVLDPTWQNNDDVRHSIRLRPILLHRETC